MGWFDGFPFSTKEERERKRKEFEKRVTPFGLDAQREKLKDTLQELFPRAPMAELLYAFFDAKDAYTKKEDKTLGLAAARLRFRDLKWVSLENEEILLRLLEIESGIESLDEFPTASQVLEEINSI